MGCFRTTSCWLQAPSGRVSPASRRVGIEVRNRSHQNIATSVRKNISRNTMMKRETRSSTGTAQGQIDRLGVPHLLQLTSQFRDFVSGRDQLLHRSSVLGTLAMRSDTWRLMEESSPKKTSGLASSAAHSCHGTIAAGIVQQNNLKQTAVPRGVPDGTRWMYQ